MYYPYMKLRRSIGVFLLGLLVYYLIADPRFRAGFFSISAQPLLILTGIGACILPDRFAWPFMGALGCLFAYDLLFVPDDSVAPGSDLIPEIALVIVFFALAYLTFKSAYKKPSEAVKLPPE